VKILITGGAGCLGTNLIERYMPQGHEICIIDNFATGKKSVVSSIPNIKIIEGNVSDKETVMNAFSNFRPEIVIHSAAAYKDPQNWEEDTKTNVLGSIYVSEASKTYAVDKIINFQTALCYGKPQEIPIPVNHPTGPFTSYGISKTAGEAYLLNSGLNVISLRLANICAPRLAIGPIPTFYTRLKDGKSCFCSDTVRDFLDIEDFFELIDIILTKEVPTGAYNVSTGKGNSILDVFNVVREYLGLDFIDVPIVPPGEDDVAKVVLDSSYSEEVLGWKAKKEFKEIIENQLKWYEAHGVNDIYSHLAIPTKS